MRRLVPLLLVLTLTGCGGDDPETASPSPTASSSTAPSLSPPPTSAVTSPPATASRSPLSGTPKFRQVVVLGDLSPIYLTAPPGDERIFVAERAGRIRIVKGKTLVPEPFLDLRDLTSTDGERGLLSFAFAPDYAASGEVYVLHTAAETGSVTLARYTRSSDPDRLDPASRKVVLAVVHPRSNHNGGTILFDRSGMLLWSIGDGGGGNDPEDNAQNLGSHLGKLLRLDVSKRENGKQYAIPADNPYRDVSGALPEIYAVGLRNPWRFTLDDDGTAYIGDVGQNAIEEINVVKPADLAGANFGWPTFEGRRRTNKPDLPGNARPVEPTLVYNHNDGECAVTGGFVYRGRVTALRGKYLYGDLCRAEVLAVTPGERDADALRTGMKTEQLVSFGRDGFGDVYVISLAGYVWRIAV